MGNMYKLLNETRYYLIDSAQWKTVFIPKMQKITKKIGDYEKKSSCNYFWRFEKKD